uniref:Xyloglucan endotransglucosylase/hydrolase n=1 Tax=Oryza meridionalis TaxID=40149 RepID=A0A0E0DZN4_9ORYZ
MVFQVQQPWLLLLHFVAFAILLTAVDSLPPAPPPLPAVATVFDDNYVATYGGDGYHLVNQGAQISLTLDKSSGAGFRSKLMYGSGFFHMRIKVPAGYTAGVVTAYYLASEPDRDVQDEVDFEFLGDKDGNPITLQTNVFVGGHGDREQRLRLWFDPAADFHDYSILWNPFHLVIFVDETPVRVLKNLTSRGPEFEFPAKPMRPRGSVWDGSDWATDGGRTKVDWARAPFTAAFQGFAVDACAAAAGGGVSSDDCGSPDTWWWNGGEYRRLTAAQQAAYDGVRGNLTYDYCTDKSKNHPVPPPECSFT